jgi:hypothetical protein
MQKISEFIGKELDRTPTVFWLVVVFVAGTCLVTLILKGFGFVVRDKKRYWSLFTSGANPKAHESRKTDIGGWGKTKKGDSLKRKSPR